MKSIGVSANQADLEYFKLLPASQTLFEKAGKENHIVNVYIKEDCLVNTTKNAQSYEGSFIASFIRYLLVRQQRSFSFETVMSHPSKINELETIFNKGYRVYLYFVCIDSPEVNISRVEDRVNKGGHNVAADKIVDRYYRTLNLLNKVLPLCYRAYLFDNSGKNIQMIAEVYQGSMSLHTDCPPKWFLNYVLPHYKVL
ncbi:MAG: hypothetical protein IPO92_22035 [Saprospiraceae bacterium]|nr:hypothetical protein [Saprospiraceae bacterium]